MKNGENVLKILKNIPTFVSNHIYMHLVLPTLVSRCNKSSCYRNLTCNHCDISSPLQICYIALSIVSMAITVSPSL